MGIIAIFTGIVFLANPFFRMLDILPDAIGCLFIAFGCSKLSYIDHRIADAKKYALYLAAVSALKIPLAFYITTKQKGYLLPATFIYSILECMLMIGIFVSLIGGLQYLTSRENCNDSHFKNSENASVICFAFSIARAVLSFLPEVLSLGTQKDNFDYTFVPTPEQNAALLKPYAELFSFVLVFIGGIYFAYVCGRYLIGLANDRDFIAALRSRYEVYLSQNVSEVNFRRVRLVLWIFFISLLLLFNQILDYVNIIPNVLSYISMFALSFYMIKKLDCAVLKPCLIVYLPLSVLSVYNNIVQTKLLSQTGIDFIYDKMIIRSIPKALEGTAELPMIVAPVILEYVIAAVLLIFIIRSLDNLEFLRDKDSVSIFEILFAAGTAVYFISTCYVYFGQFIRTAFTALTKNIEVYIKYDIILSVCEWTSLISFFVMIYFAYKYSDDILSRVKPEKEDSEH